MALETRNYDPASQLGAAVSVQNLINIYAGVGDPTFVAPKGSIYSKTDANGNKSRLWVNTDGNTDWAYFSTDH